MAHAQTNAETDSDMDAEMGGETDALRDESGKTDSGSSEVANLTDPATINVRAYNRRAWDAAVARRSEWTIPVGPEVVAAARQGAWSIILTPDTPVPRSWFPADLHGVRVLCLASGGGQQGPILAAAGAQVTVFDNSPRQLAQDRYVASREGLTIRTVEGDMADLSVFADGTFDLIVHPVSNVFVPDVRVVWREAFRVLAAGGTLLAGFMNPAYYIFDPARQEEGEFVVRYPLPYSDLTSLDASTRQEYLDNMQPMEYSHSLDDQIGGQLDAGFLLAGLFEDHWTGVPLSDYMPIFIATRAVKL
ncbi:MAG: class I SAM-dependent methyltransferase [Litorilinea sp.]